MEHTAGPWRVSENKHNILTDYRGNQPVMLASIMHDVGSNVIPTSDEHDEAHANGRLIAAAPELLEAARGILDSYDERDLECSPRILVAVHAAIAKAEGQE